MRRGKNLLHQNWRLLHTQLTAPSSSHPSPASTSSSSSWYWVLLSLSLSPSTSLQMQSSFPFPLSLYLPLFILPGDRATATSTSCTCVYSSSFNVFLPTFSEAQTGPVHSCNLTYLPIRGAASIRQPVTTSKHTASHTYTCTDRHAYTASLASPSVIHLLAHTHTHSHTIPSPLCPNLYCPHQKLSSPLPGEYCTRQRRKRNTSLHSSPH